MADYIFLDDGRRVDITDGDVNVFPDHGFDFNAASHIGNMERDSPGWRLTRAGRDVGHARTKKDAVLQLLEDAAEDLAAEARAKDAKLERYNEAVAAVQSFLPDYRCSPTFGPFLVFSPEQVLELLMAATDSGYDEDEDAADDAADDEDGGEPMQPAPSQDDLDRVAAEHIGVTYSDDPEAIAALAAIAITNGAWRNTHLEDLHAGSHPSGGIPDADMMRFNIATSRIVSELVTPTSIAWPELVDALTDPDRVLPGGLTVGELAGDEFPMLENDIVEAFSACHATEEQHGLPYALMRFALHGSMTCKQWYGTPWWPDAIEAFMDLLSDPGSVAWGHDGRSQPEPASVADRDALRAALLTEPEALDDDGIYWCMNHGLGHRAADRGYARWRTRLDPAWENPAPWLMK